MLFQKSSCLEEPIPICSNAKGSVNVDILSTRMPEMQRTLPSVCQDIVPRQGLKEARPGLRREKYTLSRSHRGTHEGPVSSNLGVLGSCSTSQRNAGI